MMLEMIAKKLMWVGVVSFAIGAAYWSGYHYGRQLKTEDQEYSREKYQPPSPPKCECPAVDELSDSGVVDSEIYEMDPDMAAAEATLDFVAKWIRDCKEDRFIYKNLLELCQRQVARLKEARPEDGGAE